ncbi:hypothetical protein GGP78_003169 [Salinibacter ruber]|nr:hypothetical protein [Salinibacter ruber]
MTRTIWTAMATASRVRAFNSYVKDCYADSCPRQKIWACQARMIHRRETVPLACRCLKLLPRCLTYWTRVPGILKQSGTVFARRNCPKSWRSTNQSSRGPTSRLATSRPVWRRVPGHYETQAVRLETSLGYHLASDCALTPAYQNASPGRQQEL